MIDKLVKGLKILVLLLFITSIREVFSATKNTVFMSLKFNEVNLRAGPSLEFPILFTYKLKNIPVKVVGEYDKWLKVIDKDGDSGWISEHLLSKARTVIVIKDNQLLYSNYNKESYPVYRIEKNVIGRLLKCKFNRCKIKISKNKGWIDKTAIWGLEEEIDR
ncbi:MAG: SH3 domain-containing protein [Rickettsiales bacterium]|nr:SH3 domain-containing protein [Rickettsiales bacterium]